MGIRKCPCLECALRYVGCHSNCCKYMEYKKYINELNDRIKKCKSESRPNQSAIEYFKHKLDKN